MARDVRVAILGDSRDFSRAVRDARHDADRLDGSFSRVSQGASRMSAAIGIAAVGGIAIGANAVRGFLSAAEESQQVTRQTQAVIRSMGGASNVTAQQVARLSTRLSLMSGIDDELIQGGQNVLLTFGRVRNEIGEGNNVFDRATEAALNMSVALGTDLNSASMMVGKALNDPIRGLTALRRSGIQFSDSQERTIRTMVEQNNVAGAQKIMLEELERQFGGSAEAQATASDKLRVAWGNIQEQIGTALLPAFESAATWLTERLPGAMTTAGEFVDDLRVKWEEFTTFLFGEEDWDSFWSDVGNGIDEFKVLWDDYVKDLQRGWEEFTDEVFGDGTTWDSFWQDLRDLDDEFMLHWDDYIADLKRGWDAFIDPFRDDIEWLQGVLGFFGRQQNAPNIIDDAIENFGLNQPNKPPELAAPKTYGNTPIAGPFASGGIMPGPRGKHSLALVAGGETILPTHKSGYGAGMGPTIVLPGKPDPYTLECVRAILDGHTEASRDSFNRSVA